MAEVFYGGGTSSIELSRSAKGQYTYAIKLYFIGNSMREIRQNIDRIDKARIMLEERIGQRVKASKEMKETETDLSAKLEAAKQEEVEKAKEAKGEGK